MANASLRGGLHFAGLAAVFYGVQVRGAAFCSQLRSGAAALAAGHPTRPAHRPSPCPAHPPNHPPLQTLSGVYRGQRDFLDTAHGGMAAGAVFGLSREWAGARVGAVVGRCAVVCCACFKTTSHRAHPLPLLPPVLDAPPPAGPAVHRTTGARVSPLRSVVLGAALGASMGIPFGLLHDKVVRACRCGWREPVGPLEGGMLVGGLPVLWDQPVTDRALVPPDPPCPSC